MSHQRAAVGLVSVAVGAIGLVVVAPPAASAVTVATEAELRAALVDTSEDLITLTADIAITSCTDTGTDDEWGDLDRSDGDPLTIEGGGHTLTQTCADERIIEFDGSNQVTINDLTMAGGDMAGLGGAMYFQNGQLVVNDSLLVDNHAVGSGGAINGDFATIILEGTTVAGNSAANVGGVYSNGPVIVINSTITGNTSSNNTGGVAAFDDLTLVYATVVGNTGPGGSNVEVRDPEATFSAAGSVIADPIGGTNCVLEGPSASDGYSFVDDASCDLTGPGDVQDGGDPLLGALADNGGPTPTRLPEPGSPLIDHVDLAACTSGGPTEDQRGTARPAGTGCDTGAVEVQASDIEPNPDPEPDPGTDPDPGPDQPEAPAARPVVTEPTLTG